MPCQATDSITWSLSRCLRGPDRWQPTGILLILAELVFTATDPPLRLLRRVIPTVRIGSVALDLSFMVLFFVVIFAMQAVQLL